MSRRNKAAAMLLAGLAWSGFQVLTSGWSERQTGFQAETAAAFALPVSEWLDRFERGDPDAIVGVLDPPSAWQRLTSDFATEALAWIRAPTPGPSAVRHRQEVVAAFVLELGHALVERRASAGTVSEPAEPDAEFVRRWQWLRGAIEWTCERVRSWSLRAEFERTWFRFSFDLLELAGDQAFLYGAGAPTGIERIARPSSGRRHLDHGLDRFPDDAEFRLLELEGPPTLWFMAVRWLMDGTAVSPARFEELEAEAGAARLRRAVPRGLRHPTDTIVTTRVQFLRQLVAARSNLTPLLASKEVGARVHVDLGLIAWCFADQEGALSHFAAAAALAQDERLEFLALFLTGRVRGRAGNAAESEAAYRRALALRPASQTAGVALAELLFTSGRVREARELVNRVIESAASDLPRLRPSDPWLEFVTAGRLVSDRSRVALRRGIGR